MYTELHMAVDFVTVARLRAEMAGILKKLRRQGGPLYLTQRGEPRAVLLPVDEYRALIDQLEHLDDSIEALLARDRRERGEEDSRPLEQIVRGRRGDRRASPTAQRGRRTRARVPR